MSARPGHRTVGIWPSNRRATAARRFIPCLPTERRSGNLPNQARTRDRRGPATLVNKNYKEAPAMTTFRFKNLGLLLLFLLILFTFSCSKKAAVVQPPAPAPVAPVVPPPAPTITLRANPATVDRGQPVTLAWEARNAANVQIDPGLGAVMATGNRMVNPTSSVTYTAKAIGPGG